MQRREMFSRVGLWKQRKEQVAERDAARAHSSLCGELREAGENYTGVGVERRCWKHSRQYTGRPWVGLKGTVVSLPHCEHVVVVSTR